MENKKSEDIFEQYVKEFAAENGLTDDGTDDGLTPFQRIMNSPVRQQSGPRIVALVVFDETVDTEDEALRILRHVPKVARIDAETYDADDQSPVIHLDPLF
jgi:hypothetical protein